MTRIICLLYSLLYYTNYYYYHLLIKLTNFILFQKLRPTTRRRFKLDESPLTPNTPRTRSKCLLGRTPTKMYSPFAIDTPPSLRRRFAYRRNKHIETER